MGVDLNITPTAGMAPIVTETTPTLIKPGVSGIQQSPAVAQAVDADVAQAGAVADAQAAVGPATAQALEGKAAGLDLVDKQATADLAERQGIIDARQPLIKAAKQEADAAEAQLADHKFYDYWSTKTTGDKIMARIGAALVTAGNIKAGVSGNAVLDKINRDIDRDFEQQKIRLHSKEQAAAYKKAGVKDMYDQLQRDLAAVEVKQAKAHEAVAAKSEAMAIRAGIPEAEAKQNVVAVDQMGKATQKRVEAEQRYEKRIEAPALVGSTATTANKGAPGGGGVEADKGAANFDVLKAHGEKIAATMPTLSPEDTQAVNRVMNSEDYLDGKPLITTLATVFGKDSETGVSSTAKAYLADVRAAAEGLGRVQSGAAIGSVENKRFVRSLMPQMSDRPEDREMRAGNIRADIAARGAHLSRPARTPTPGTAATPGPGTTVTSGVPPIGTVQRNKVTGVLRIADGKGGWQVRNN